MFNLRVRDLDATLKRLKQEGVTVIEKVETYEYGKFGWIVDLEGNKIELWQPLNEEEQFKKKKMSYCYRPTMADDIIELNPGTAVGRLLETLLQRLRRVGWRALVWQCFDGVRFDIRSCQALNLLLLE